MAIFWSANESHGNFALKSACLPQVLPLLEMGDVHWVVLQRGHQMKLWLADERSASATNVLQPLSVDDTTSLLAQLDGAVVVDTAVAHIAASLGVPTMLLLGGSACWRWETFSHGTPWYPSMRLFRPATIGDWAGAVSDVAAALAGDQAAS
jgi:ADP-heptose:LPS heptosyltransferase